MECLTAALSAAGIKGEGGWRHASAAPCVASTASSPMQNIIWLSCKSVHQGPKLRAMLRPPSSVAWPWQRQLTRQALVGFIIDDYSCSAGSAHSAFALHLHRTVAMARSPAVRARIQAASSGACDPEEAADFVVCALDMIRCALEWEHGHSYCHNGRRMSDAGRYQLHKHLFFPHSISIFIMPAAWRRA